MEKMTMSMEMEAAHQEALERWEAGAPERRRLAREAARAWGEAARMWEEAPESLRQWVQKSALSMAWEWGKQSPEEGRRFALELAGEGGSRAELALAGAAWLGALCFGDREAPFTAEVIERWETPGEPQYPMRSAEVEVYYDEGALAATTPGGMAVAVKECVEMILSDKDWSEEPEGELSGYEFMDSGAPLAALRGHWGQKTGWARAGAAVESAFERALLEESTPEAPAAKRSGAGLRV